MSQNIINFNEALNLLEDISKETAFEVDIFSIKTPLKLKDLNSSHIKILFENLDKNLIFEKIFLQILKEVVIDKNLKIEELSILDMACIAVKLRTRISEKISLNFFKTKNILQENISEDSAKIIEVSLMDVYDNLFKKLYEVYNFLNNCLIRYKEITIELKLPTIFSYSSKTNSEDEMEGLLVECSRFINSIYIKEKVIKFSDSEENNLKLLELLPAAILQPLTEKILNFKNLVAQALIVSTDKEGETYQAVLTIDDTLFFTD